jgi:putative nucleotidyltransferase with HDIG domain
VHYLNILPAPRRKRKACTDLPQAALKWRMGWPKTDHLFARLRLLAMTTPASPTVSVRDLRVGMFVHLDLSWMSHPFPLGSFRISHPDEIATIAALGLQSVRWSPERSELPGAAPAAPPAAPAAPQSPEQAERARRHAALAAQRQAESLCQRQHAEAARAWRQCQDQVLAQPKVAGRQAEALAGALAGKMMVEQDLCIRVLTGLGGDHASSHALNVAVISMLMARQFGMDADDLADLGTGALMHDVGKLELPDRVRHAAASFSSAETRLYREHVTHGVTLARRMELRPGAQLVVAQHHEAADGSGFPLQLNLDRMSAAARIVAMVNRYDNLCNPAQPSTALTPHESLSLLFAQGRDKFDATMLGAFIRMMGVYPPGSLVQLTDDRWALVITVNSTRPLKPRVLVYQRKGARGDGLLLDLETEPALGIRRSLKPSQVPGEALEYLAPPPRLSYFFEPAPADADLDEAPA